MTDRSETARQGWVKRRRMYGETGTDTSLSQDEKYIALLLDRWLYTHKIGDIGKRAAEETA